MSYKSEHGKRIRQELTDAGASSYGLLKLESRYLPQIIHEDEHIEAIAYGKHNKDSSMLIATSKRVIFLDRKPGITNHDEVSYDMVSGVARDSAGLYSTVTLHTRVRDYSLSFVRQEPALRFVKYIEQRRLETNHSQKQSAKKAAGDGAVPETAKVPPLLSADEQAFLLNHGVMVLSTTDKGGELSGNVVYYLVGENNYLYMITKSETSKLRNMRANPKVAVTIFDEDEMQVLQMRGTIEIEKDNNSRETVFQQIVKPRKYGKRVSWPPVTKIKDGSYVVVRITPTEVKFVDYKYK